MPPPKLPRTGARTSMTPVGHLGEIRLHSVIGYQVAQASISTVGVFDRLVGDELQLRPVEYTILTLIAENPGVAPAKLAQALAVTAPNITVWIDRLVKRALVTRSKSETDKRAQHLHTTPAGEALATAATARLVEGEQVAFAALSDGERTILIELLHKLALLRPKDRGRSSAPNSKPPPAA